MTNALSDVSFWFDAIGELPPADVPPLPQQLDVAIVGAGYTGLWSAYYLKQRDPALRIGVFEAERVGFGASGRNGGWCVGMAWGVEPLLANPQKRSRGIELARALFDTVDEVGRVCQAENIDAHYAKGGTLTVATIPFQVPHLQQARRAHAQDRLRRQRLPLAAGRRIARASRDDAESRRGAFQTLRGGAARTTRARPRRCRAPARHDDLRRYARQRNRVRAPDDGRAASSKQVRSSVPPKAIPTRSPGSAAASCRCIRW